MNVADACCVNGKCVGCGPETSGGWAETGESGEPPAETGCEDCDEEDFEDCPLGGELSAEPLAQLNRATTQLAVASADAQPGKQLVALGPDVLEVWLGGSWIISQATGLVPDEVHVLDVDDDGIDELLTLDRAASQVQSWQGDGFGLYTAGDIVPIELDDPSEPHLSALVFDYLGDGDPDLFVIDRGNVWLLHNQDAMLALESLGVSFGSTQVLPLTVFQGNVLDGERVVVADALGNDADTVLRTWPTWPGATFKHGALPDIEQGATIDEPFESRLWVRSGSALQTWTPQGPIEPLTIELGGPVELLAFRHAQGQAIALIDAQRVRVIEGEQCTWEATLTGAELAWQFADLDDDGEDELLGHSLDTGAVFRHSLALP